MKTLYIKLISDNSENYYRNHNFFHKGDSGLDLFLLEDIEISLGETKFIDLGIQCQMVEKNEELDYVNPIDVSYYLYPRSSFSKYPLIMGNHVGIIDSSYRGNIIGCVKYILDEYNIKKICENITDKNKSGNDIYNNIPKLRIPAGTRLFQICSGNLEPFDIKIVEELTTTSRGSGGFGSTNL